MCAGRLEKLCIITYCLLQVLMQGDISTRYLMRVIRTIVLVVLGIPYLSRLEKICFITYCLLQVLMKGDRGTTF